MSLIAVATSTTDSDSCVRAGTQLKPTTADGSTEEYILYNDVERGAYGV